MQLSIPRIVLMSRLLDEALPLDAAERRAWLEKLSPEYSDLAPALREALLPGDSPAGSFKVLSTLPKLGSTDEAQAQPAGDLQAGARVGPYELIRPLGAGGMAQVWLARRADGAFKREVALKLPALTHLRADLEQRFARERDILASLEHSHIARFYDAGIDSSGLPYVAMEYVHGEPLTDWCDAHRLQISARLELFLQVLAGVQYAHEKHVVHRDLKPSNIPVTESGQVQLLDFGVAKLLEAEEVEKTPLTRVYGRALTPDYASPELLRGDRLDPRSDVYSLGVVLYELLTGVRPYRLKSAASMGLLEEAIDTVDVKKPSTQIEPEAVATRASTREQLRGDLDAIALKALAKDPTQRYPSAAALAEDLRRYLEGKPIEAQPARFPYRLRKFLRRNKAMIGVSALAVAAILGTVGYTLYREAVYQVKVMANAVPVLQNVIPEKSIAVLPFVNMSSDKEQEYFSEGLSEELIDMLTKVPDLRVPARTSSFYFKGKQVTVAEIAKALSVAHVLEGSVRKSGNTLRVTAQLIRADNGYHLWSETYDRELKDVFKVQDEIAGAVVTALKLHLLPTQPAAQDELRTTNIEAFNQYLEGRQSFNRGDAEGYQRAVTAFTAATTLDPHYAAAYAALALAQFWVADQISDVAGNEAASKSALASAEKAVALDRKLGAGYAARGFIRAVYVFDFAGGKADLDEAVALSPHDADVLHRSAIVLAILGNLPAAVAREKEALELDPLSAEICMRLGFFFAANQQLAEARPLYERALAIAPNSVRALANLGDLELLENRPEQALATFRQNENEVFRLSGQAMAEYSLGHADVSQRFLKQLITRGDAYHTARVYAWRGEKDHALQWLERSYVKREPPLTWIKIDHFSRSLRGDARYKAPLRKMNLPE